MKPRCKVEESWDKATRVMENVHFLWSFFLFLISSCTLKALKRFKDELDIMRDRCVTCPLCLVIARFEQSTTAGCCSICLALFLPVRKARGGQSKAQYCYVSCCVYLDILSLAWYLPDVRLQLPEFLGNMQQLVRILEVIIHYICGTSGWKKPAQFVQEK